MNSKPIKSASLVSVFVGVLMLLGMAGFVNPAFAAGEIIINDDATVTNYHQVDLYLAPPPGSATMSFRNSTNAQWSPAEAAADFKQSWMLAGPDGDKTVLVQFKDEVGNVLGIYSDTIRLDYIIDTNFFNPNGSTNFGNPEQYKTAGHAVTVQSDQKIVVVGTVDNGGGNSQLQVIRYNPDGSYDPDFGAGSGMVYYGNPTGAYSGNAVAVHPVSGKIVVTGTYDFQDGTTGLWLLQLLPDGSLDPDFNPDWGGGFLVTGGAGSSSGNAVTFDAAGRTVVVGTYEEFLESAITYPWVLRFDDLGNPDTTFNGRGDALITADIDGAHRGNGVAIDSNGNIVVVGTLDNGDETSSVWVVRLNEAGEIDTTFGGNDTGETTFGSNGLHTGNAVAIDSTGNISVVGTFDWTGGNTDLWLLRLDSAGLLVETFNPNPAGIPPGTVALGGPGADSGSAVIIQPDGKTVVVGSYDNGTFSIINGEEVPNTSLLVQRISADGSYDVSFNRGNFSYSFGTSAPFTGQGVALQADQMIVVTGKGYGKDPASNLSLSTILTLRLNGFTWPLTITTTGTGTVAAVPGDIAWLGQTGVGSYIPGTEVQLTATPIPLSGALFIGWEGGPCDGSSDPVCTVTMDEAQSVTATFTEMYPLAVSVSGVGTVYSAPGSIVCTGTSGPGCLDIFLAGTPVTLTATRPWYVQDGFWGGGSCSGSILTPCTVTMDQGRTVSARFNSSMNARVADFDGLYPTLTQAYWDANEFSGPTAIIQAKDSAQVVFQEAPLEFNLPLTVTFQGGKGSDFSAPAVGFTSVIGPLNISNGRLNASNLKIKQP